MVWLPTRKSLLVTGVPCKPCTKSLSMNLSHNTLVAKFETIPQGKLKTCDKGPSCFSACKKGWIATFKSSESELKTIFLVSNLDS